MNVPAVRCRIPDGSSRKRRWRVRRTRRRSAARHVTTRRQCTYSGRGDNRALLQTYRALLRWCRARLWWCRALLRWYRAVLHTHSLSHKTSSSCTPGLVCNDWGLFCSGVEIFWRSSRHFGAAREHCILYTYVCLCIYVYSITSFVCWTSIYLMYNTLNTMQHTASGELHLAYITLQHTATNCNTLQRTAPNCNTLHRTVTHWNTLQHTATHCNEL